MLSSEEAKNITFVYSTIMESEIKGWSDLDNYLELLEFLDDDQLYRESEVLYSFHKNENIGCPYPHKLGTSCFVKNVLEAVEAIIELYHETNYLHPRNRYILANYISLTQDGQVCLIDS